jgi:rare lipoprotein A (peptidoglycan hydrolase)
MPAYVAVIIATMLVATPAPVIDHAVGVQPVTTAGGTTVTGRASWYATGPGAGQAAAGPALRHGHWRGSIVTVCGSGKNAPCLNVQLSDWCGCPHGRVIDLSPEDFIVFAPPSLGTTDVVIR